MNKIVILMLGMMASVITNSTHAQPIGDLNKSIIFFQGSEQTIRELIQHNPEFQDVALLHLDRYNSFHNLGTIGSPKSTSFFNPKAKILTLAGEAVWERLWWCEKANAIVVRTGTDSGLKPYDKCEQHMAMVAAMNKRFQETEKVIEQVW